MSKNNRLLVIVISILLFGTCSSILLNLTWFDRSGDEVITVGVAPRSGANAATEESVLRGASLYFEEFNNARLLSGTLIKVVNLSPKHKEHEENENAQNAAETSDVNGTDKGLKSTDNHDVKIVNESLNTNSKTKPIVAVIGKPIEKHDIPSISIYPNNVRGLSPGNGIAMGFPHAEQARFIANYTRNILGKKLITIIYEDTDKGLVAAEEFTAVYRRFNTKIHRKRVLKSASVDASISDIVTELNGRNDIGTIFLAASAKTSAAFIVKARNAKISSNIVGLDVLASSQFTAFIAQYVQGSGRSYENNKIAEYTHNLVVTSPLLFDTANESVQSFRERYVEKYNSQPDWSAAYAYEAAHLIGLGLIDADAAENSDNKQGESLNVVEKRQQGIARYFSTLYNTISVPNGILGKLDVNGVGQVSRAVKIGQYNGEIIVAAPTQLEPINAGVSVDYLDEIIDGKMLYVNNRFMYKTNVVYTGINLVDVLEINWDNNTAVVDFYIWFRYNGKFDPADIEFLNAESPVELGDPIKWEDNSHKLFRVTDTFNLDFSSAKRPYGSHILGISFRHKSLNKNNVVYVVDELGFGFDTDQTLKSQLESVYSIKQKHAQKVDRAWVAQSLTMTHSLGSPEYVGHGTINPEFSQIDFGVMIRKDRFEFHSLVPVEFLYYIGVFGLIGSLVSRGVDMRTSGLFWSVSSWGLYLVFWPLLLLSIGNIVVDIAIEQSISHHYIDLIMQAYDAGWWIVFSILVVIAMKRFVWVPLEDKAQRKVPNIIRVFSSFAIYLLAFFGVVAFVFHEPLTSFLATGGLFAMIIGLAVQSNISNVFAGIIINLAKPFTIGNYLKIRDIGAVHVIDITWRTVRVRDLGNNLICIPNSQLADSIIVNLSTDNIRTKISVFVTKGSSKALVSDLIDKALLSVEGLDETAPYSHVFVGVTLNDNIWLAEYEISFTIKAFDPKRKTEKRILAELQRAFVDEGVSFANKLQPK